MKNDDFNKPKESTLFNSLEELAESTKAIDTCLFTKFKERKREDVLEALANLKFLDKLRGANPFKDDKVSTE